MSKVKTQLIRYFLFTLYVAIAPVTMVYAQDKTNPANQPATSATQPAVATLPKPNQPVKLPDDLAAFFSGEWEGAGQFSNGKEIKADVKFSSELDKQWLLYSHQDRAPNKYKAMGMWGFERASNKFVMILQDNFGGARHFESDGWKDGKVVFVNNVTTPTISYLERFTFERQSEKSFKMTYEINKSGSEWKLGDYLVFTRKS